MADLSRKRTRDRLAVRREPYWQRLAEGAYLGFRRGPDTWLARFRGRDHNQQYKALGEALEYDEAKRKAESWLAQLTGSAVRTVKRATVRAALEAYLADLRRHGRADAATEALWRFKLCVYKDDILADLELEAATQDDFLEWRDRLRPGRQPRTVNRNVRAVVAGLNKANRLGHLGNPSAWRLTALADDVEDDGETAVFLNAEQRAAFIAAASPNAGEFLRGMELSGARPKELASATVGDFDGETLRLAHRKGKPPKLRVRHVVLGEDGVEFFKGQARDKLPSAFLFTEDGKQPWRRHMWARHVRAAIKKHNKTARGKARIPSGASAYSFRHARISELLQIHGVDPLTVAIQTGTSIAMIEKSYLRFIPSAMRAKLAGLKDSAS
jgi:integrase